ncbi:MAG: hypothetical protein J07HQW2_03372 [Haloquadratum walsbyi J07HQW2]|jgi:hypothetical protein|uniref:Transposase n=2 Tax=Haloquadratum walsbyi TaxID=293091 RepID=U1NJ06_9EURY|nr:MAG: hypothetical protein J07HQW2_03372 [Haloquadratum walsbyi J07HQW2]
MVLDVDLNVTGPFIATSTGIIGSADRLSYWKNEYERTRDGLQECGTRSAHRTLQSVSGLITKRSEHWLYKRATELVHHAVERGVDNIMFENLGGIRDAMQ